MDWHCPVYEVGYTPSLEVIDHSELMLAGTPGSPSYFKHLWPKLQKQLSETQLARAQVVANLYSRFQRCIEQKQGVERFIVGDEQIVVNWELFAAGAAVCGILTDGDPSIICLLVCNVADSHKRAMLLHGAFPTALSRFLPQEDVYDYRKFRLIEMTRRPLLASVFWPPNAPTGASTARTVQKQIAHAFFHLHGDLPERVIEPPGKPPDAEAG